MNIGAKPMKLENRLDETLIRQILDAMSIGMKGELCATLTLSDLGCEVLNANVAKVNSKHVDLLVTKNGKKVAVQVKSTSSNSRGSFIIVNDSLLQDGTVQWYCIATLNGTSNEWNPIVFVHVNDLVYVGRRFPSNTRRCEIRHNVVHRLPTLNATEWVAKVFDI
jgi:hypothetical protein